MTKNLLFYDLETNGLDYYTTGIMQIAMIDVNGKVLLNQYVYPFDQRIDCSHIHGITEQKLIDNNAIQTKDLCEIMVNLLNEQYGRDEIYLIAYNNFGYDQIILENNFKISGVKIPNNWYFIDFFPMCKELFPNIKPNFKLKTVFETICSPDNTIFHCALGDSTCLYKLYVCELHKHLDIFPKYTRSALSNDNIHNSSISSLNGYHKSINFEGKNINTIGDLFIFFKINEYDNEKFTLYLRDTLGIYSNFYINNIVKQFTIIKNLRTV